MISSSPENSSPLTSARMTGLLLGIVRSLVDQPDSVRIDVEEADSATSLRLYVAANDLGKVIGKQGRTARSLRTILSAISSKAQHRYTLDIFEQEAPPELEAQTELP